MIFGALSTSASLTIMIVLFAALLVAIYLFMRSQLQVKKLGARLEDAEEYKKAEDIRARELHHRIKNNFQTVSSLLNLQTRYIDDEGAKNILWEGQNRIKSMALIHQQLYQRDSTTLIEMGHYIDNLNHELAYSYSAEDQGIELESDVAPMSLTAGVAIPLGLVIHELVLNSFKYAFPDGQKGKITVRLHPKDETTLQLIVKDNGDGLPEGMEPLKVRTSYGMRLIILFAKELKGEITYRSANGTVATLDFPKPVAMA